MSMLAAAILAFLILIWIAETVFMALSLRTSARGGRTRPADH